MRRLFAVIAMSGTLCLPLALSAQDREHQATTNEQQGRRYQDKAHSDSHEWNSQESQMYSRYLQEHHKKPHDFEKASKKEQGDYWNWRHQHPDDQR
jgi:Ni/Co efflux regulator RcnB